ncbi:hypothetical protein F5Y16DRAFT_403177 [Xylariaceae sp. FL0255]|nr:hypothetical protein F5Y16DRAFT_403177 [Xylariaceae sp. FL0255]
MRSVAGTLVALFLPLGLLLLGLANGEPIPIDARLTAREQSLAPVLPRHEPAKSNPQNACCLPGCKFCDTETDICNCNNNWFYNVCCATILMPDTSDSSVLQNENGEKIEFVDESDNVTP